MVARVMMADSTHVFLEGPAGTGKTGYAIDHLFGLLSDGVRAENILILVPQRSLGVPYQLAVRSSEEPVHGDPTIITLAGLARRNLERFWPLIAEPAGFEPAQEPVFLTIETAQYYMMRFTRAAINEGRFDSISLSPPRIAAQILDNMAKAAVAGFPYEEVTERLSAAWGNRHSSRLQIYQTSQQLGEEYRAYCRGNGLLDYAMQLDLFMRYLLPSQAFQNYFTARHHHLIADNIEEAGPQAHVFIKHFWNQWQTALLLYDEDGGFRTFLGADPASALSLRENCTVRSLGEDPTALSTDMLSLEREVQILMNKDSAPPESNPLDGFQIEQQAFYPEAVRSVASRITQLVEDGVPPAEIVVLAPFLTDSLRFLLQSELDRAGIPTHSHRPSRALRDEASARALLTLFAMAHPHWGFPPPPLSDVADMLTHIIEGLDPVRARLLANIVYKERMGGRLSPFEQIRPEMRDRITYIAGGRYETLRIWLENAIQEHETQPIPPDYFLQRLFGEVLSQPGFGFHTNLDGGRAAAQLIESARKFRQVLYPRQYEDVDWNAVGREYLQLVNEGVLAALYAPAWDDGTIPDAVLLAPAFTFLMRNRQVDFQFWLDIGSESWWTRLDQPLTHPYVLTKSFPRNTLWTEEMEIESQREMLYRITVGLIRRCRKQVFLGISDLGEQGYEQRGPMLYLFQQILQRNRKETS